MVTGVSTTFMNENEYIHTSTFLVSARLTCDKLENTSGKYDTQGSNLQLIFCINTVQVL